MNLQEIAISKLHSIVVEQSPDPQENNKDLVLTFQANIMPLGYIMSERLFDTLCHLDNDSISKIYLQTYRILEKSADICFGFDGDVTPFDVDVINSEYIS